MFADVTEGIGPQTTGKSSGRNYEIWPHSTILSHSDLLLLFLAVPDIRLPLCPAVFSQIRHSLSTADGGECVPLCGHWVPAPVHIREHLALQDKREISSLPGPRGCVPRGDPSLARRLLPASRAVLFQTVLPDGVLPRWKAPRTRKRHPVEGGARSTWPFTAVLHQNSRWGTERGPRGEGACQERMASGTSRPCREVGLPHSDGHFWASLRRVSVLEGPGQRKRRGGLVRWRGVSVRGAAATNTSSDPCAPSLFQEVRTPRSSIFQSVPARTPGCPPWWGGRTLVSLPRPVRPPVPPGGSAFVTPSQPNHLPQATPSYCPTGGQDCDTCILGAHGHAVHNTKGQHLVRRKCCPSANVGTPGRQVRNDRGLWGRWRARPGTGIRRARVAEALRCRKVSSWGLPSSLPPPTEAEEMDAGTVGQGRGRSRGDGGSAEERPAGLPALVGDHQKDGRCLIPGAVTPSGVPGSSGLVRMGSPGEQRERQVLFSCWGSTQGSSGSPRKSAAGRLRGPERSGISLKEGAFEEEQCCPRPGGLPGSGLRTRQRRPDHALPRTAGPTRWRPPRWKSQNPRGFSPQVCDFYTSKFYFLKTAFLKSVIFF